MSKLIYLYRHGETDFNVEGITMGQLEGIDTNFTKKGYEQINLLSEEIKEHEIEVIYTSDYKRTLETSKLINNNLPIFINKEIRGLNMGKYQGMDFNLFIKLDEVQKSFTDYNIPFENGESINELNNRILNFIIRICHETNYEKIAIVTHSAVISNLKSFITKEPFMSLNKCCLLYKDNKFYVIDYVTSKEEKQKIKKRYNYV